MPGSGSDKADRRLRASPTPSLPVQGEGQDGDRVRSRGKPLQGFPPIAAADARVLILGSMPGAASLAAGQYYAHPRNAFWTILGELVGARPGLAYADRVEILRTRRIAVWDVLASCIREGSLDSRIEADSLLINDFPGFFRAHPEIGQVFFNGATAETLFRRHVWPALATAWTARLKLHRLPSTSPANASRSASHKIAEWRRVFDAI